MLPTFVIGLREGVEASLIVGIVAAFVLQQGRRDALRSIWIGVGLALALCVAVGVGLNVLGSELPQREQEALETVVGAIAVGMVTTMIVWMRRHARGLKKELEARAGGALAAGSVMALVAMAFFAVLREGFETSVFLLAAFQASTNAFAAGMGALLGVLVAVIIGYGIYRGGVKINLARFFRLTGFVLVLVAAGLVATALHTGVEAGWWSFWQERAVDLRWLVQPGTPLASILTGMLGLQPEPTVLEAVGYLLYLVPVGAYVLWPQGRRPLRARVGRTAVASSALLALALVLGACGSSGSGSGSSDGEGKTVNVALTDAGCSPAQLSLPAGPTTFEVVNEGADKVTEFEVLQDGRMIGEKENLTAGLSGSFSVTLEPGEYELYCPNGTSDERGKLTVTGSSDAAATRATPAERQAVREYREYAEGQAELLIDRTERFVAAVKAGDVARAKDLYATTRAPYERIEPVAEAFGGLDPAIDAREGDVPKAQWGGFHHIERALWVRGTTKGEGAVADKLLADVHELEEKVESVELEPAQIANGAVELLGEVARSKVTGEEERYSHTDLVDFEANVVGARKAFEAVKPLLAERDAGLASELPERFTAVEQALAQHAEGAGYVSYTELGQDEVRTLARHVDALAEPLSEVAAAIV